MTRTRRNKHLSPASLLLAIALLLGLTACASGPSRQSAVVDSQQTQAEQLIRLGEFRRASDLYLDMAAQYPEQADVWKLRSAEALREEGDLEAMRQVLSSVRSSQLPRDELILLDLLLAESELSRDRAVPALDLLSWPASDVPPRLLSRFHELRARALLAIGEFENSARERLVLNARLDQDEQFDNELQLLDTLALMPFETLRDLLATTTKDDLLYNWLLAAASRNSTIDFADSSFETPETIALDTVGNDDYTSIPGGVWQPEGYKPPRRVAILLPQSGALRSAAAAVRDGILSAYFADPGERPELQFIDSGEQPTDALIAYQQASTSGADRILGPLSREAVTMLMERGIITTPTLMLNQADQVPFVPANTLQFGFPPEDEARLAAERLIALREPRALIISMGGELNDRLARAFTETLQDAEGRVLGEARIDNDVSELAGLMQNLLGYADSRARQRRIASITGLNLAFEPSRRADLDALFIVATAVEARPLMAQLRTLGVNDLTWIGTSRAHSIVSSPQDRDLDGLQFNDQPWMLGESRGLTERDQLAAQLPSAAGASGRLFALGVDAYRLLPYLDWMQVNQHIAFPGVSGFLRVGPQGKVIRELVWARYRGGQVRRIGTGGDR